jgi:hypothetical protein
LASFSIEYRKIEIVSCTSFPREIDNRSFVFVLSRESGIILPVSQSSIEKLTGVKERMKSYK